MAQRRDTRLCYNCPAEFSKEHMKECTMKGIYLLEIDDNAPADDPDTEDVCASLHAITGIASSTTMHLGVTLENTHVRALVDSGSTHCFVATATAHRLGLDPLPRPGLTIGIANGDRIACVGVCPAVPITIGSERFDIDIFIIPLGGCEMVLGCQWLRTLGPILWDFKRLAMSFWRSGHRVQWIGLDAGIGGRVTALSGDNLLPLLAEFEDLFAAPRGLPPARAMDHRIHLRPYRYSQLLKDEIERQCDDMLQQGLIRQSTSPFLSPVLLVRKKDKS
jgi:hypothetical protein